MAKSKKVKQAVKKLNATSKANNRNRNKQITQNNEVLKSLKEN